MEGDDSTHSFSSKEIITYVSQLTLKHDETRFSISFGSVNPVYPNQVTYRYKLSNFENDWIYVDDERSAQFNNISFGSYTFSVQAKEPGKSWSESKNLQIIIERPPWLHTVALVFYCLIFHVVQPQVEMLICHLGRLCYHSGLLALKKSDV